MPAPIIEWLATGDEVVGGDVADTNGAFVSQQLIRYGLFIERHTALPDRRELLIEGIEQIAKRADLCVMCGGLGPTEDDLTAEVMAKVIGTQVVIDQPALSRMKARFRTAGYRFSENNLRSAQVPVGSEVFQNEVGTAPAFSVTVDRCRFFCLPGVPREFRDFVVRVVVPWCRERWGGGFGSLVQLKTLGWGESHLAEQFADFGQLFPQVTVGYRAHSPEVWLKLSARAGSTREAQQLVQPAVKEARRRVGSTIFATDDETLDRIVHQLLIERNQTLALAESCTGGRIASLLTQHAGSSSYFLGGVVCYSNASKQAWLGVPSELLATQGAVSAKVAASMAVGAATGCQATHALAVTGIAGPGGATPDKPVGLVFIAHAGPTGTRVIERRFRGDRDRIQRAAALTALEMLRRFVLQLAPLASRDGEQH
jgi:nicotinamide-nucleotide amidase